MSLSQHRHVRAHVHRQCVIPLLGLDWQQEQIYLLGDLVEHKLKVLCFPAWGREYCLSSHAMSCAALLTRNSQEHCLVKPLLRMRAKEM